MLVGEKSNGYCEKVFVIKFKQVVLKKINWYIILQRELRKGTIYKYIAYLEFSSKLSCYHV